MSQWKFVVMILLCLPAAACGVEPGSPDEKGDTSTDSSEGDTSAESDTDAPSVQTVMGMGNILGAVVDTDVNQLYVIGEPGNGDSIVDESYIATAILCAMHEMPYVSIDPVEGNLESDWMNVLISPLAKDTRLGWTLFEADRVLKGYSLGADSITHFPLLSGVPLFRNMFDIIFDEGSDAGGDKKWSRFWFVPGNTSAEMSANAIDLVSAGIQLKTQVMVEVNGQLEDAKDATDKNTDLFAGFFTEHYSSFAREKPILNELQQALRLLMVGKWLQRSGIFVHEQWLAHHGNHAFTMPVVTPALRRTVTKSGSSAEGEYEQSLELLGGVSLEEINLTETASSLHLNDYLPEFRLAAQTDTQGYFVVENQGQTFVGYSIPLGSANYSSGIEIAVSAPLADGNVLNIYKKPNGGDTSRIEILLPKLANTTVTEPDGSTYVVTILTGEEVPVRTYTLYGQDGQYLGFFDGHYEEGETGLTFVDSPDSDWKLYLLSASYALAVSAPTGEQLAFHVESGLLVEQLIGEITLKYEYADTGLLQRITDASTLETVVAFSHGSNHTRIPGATVPATGETVIFEKLPEGGEPVTLRAYAEGNESTDITIQPGTFDWSTLSPIGGLDYLNRSGPEILKRLREAPGNSHLISSGAITLLLANGEIRPLPFPISSYSNILDMLMWLGHNEWPGLLPAGDGAFGLLSTQNDSLSLRIYGGDKDGLTVLGADAAKIFWRMEAAHAGNVSTPSVQALTVQRSEDLATILFTQGNETKQMNAGLWQPDLDNVNPGSTELVDFLTPDSAKIAVISAVNPSLAGPQGMREATPHDIHAAAPNATVYKDDKIIDAMVRLERLESVLSTQLAIRTAGYAVVDGTPPATLIEALNHITALGIPHISSDSTADLSRQIVVSDLDDTQLAGWFESNKGALEGKGIILLRKQYPSNNSLYTRLIKKVGLLYITDHEVPLGDDEIRVIVQAIGDVVTQAGPLGIHDNDIFKTAVDFALTNPNLSEELRLQLTRLKLRTMLKLSFNMPLNDTRNLNWAAA
ncbi:MAG: hypothetical protein JXR76_24995 [Deltaproteobacteria bacterium]|nr:hypothetical protein [Deltaproteobacteria bacterium]